MENINKMLKEITDVRKSELFKTKVNIKRFYTSWNIEETGSGLYFFSACIMIFRIGNTLKMLKTLILETLSK